MTSVPPDTTPLLCTLVREGEGAPFVLVPSAGTTPLALVRLARAITPRRAVHAFAYAGLEDESPPHRTIEAMASAYVAELVARLPHGPYLLGGHCFGGEVALAMALELEARGRAVERLVVVDAIAPLTVDVVAGRRAAAAAVDPKLEDHIRQVLKELVRRTVASMPALEPAQFARLSEIVALHVEAGVAFRAHRLRAPIDVLRTAGFREEGLEGWTRIAAGGLRRHDLPGDTFSMLKPPHVEAAGGILGRLLRGDAG